MAFFRILAVFTWIPAEYSAILKLSRRVTGRLLDCSPAFLSAVEREILIMETGKVKWFDNMKRFGLLVTDDGVDVFVQISDDFMILEPGQPVSFDVIESSHGLNAINVRIL